ncbi:hypothetical protein BG004_005553 [Podila humilis]|nr:hypothetical protein BG004_005553 [Podila humilis]
MARPTYVMCVLTARSSRSGNESIALGSVVDGSSSQVDSSARKAAMSLGSIPSVARRRGHKTVLGLISHPKSRCTHPSNSGICSYFLGPVKLAVETDFCNVLVEAVLENPLAGRADNGDVAVAVAVEGDVAMIVDAEEAAVQVIVVVRGDDDIAPSGVAVENRLEARLEPLGGGVQVRLIFSNGMEHSESDEDE